MRHLLGRRRRSDDRFGFGRLGRSRLFLVRSQKLAPLLDNLSPGPVVNLDRSAANIKTDYGQNFQQLFGGNFEFSRQFSYVHVSDVRSKILNCRFKNFWRPGRESPPEADAPLAQNPPSRCVYFCLRPGRESNPRIEVLQTSALPLGYQALGRSKSTMINFTDLCLDFIRLWRNLATRPPDLSTEPVYQKTA